MVMISNVGVYFFNSRSSHRLLYAVIYGVSNNGLKISSIVHIISKEETFNSI